MRFALPAEDARRGTYDSDMALVRSTLESAATAFPGRLRRLRSGLQEAIRAAFGQHRITLAYAQLDAHFDARLLEVLTRSAA